MYILEDDFEKILINKEEKELIEKMDTDGLTVTKLDSNITKLLKEIKKGKNIYLCKEYKSTEIKKCELKEVPPLELNIITYDNDYVLYSYIIANNEKEAYKIFIKKMEELGLYKNGNIISGINIDEKIFVNKNKISNNRKIELKDNNPKRTKERNKKSEEMLEMLKSIF